MINLLILIIAAFPLQAAAQADTTGTDPFRMATWEMFKRGTADGHLAYVRGNTAFRELKNRQRYPYRVGFAVRLRKPNSYGLPTEAEAHDLSLFENEIDRMMTGKHMGFLALVITTGGMKEYVYYTGRPDAVRSQIKKLGGAVQGREFRSYVTADPGWDVYFRFVR